ncbi:lysozyme inhibitor LprI family protein [Clostridium celatum]|uniref:lysozyme inhibitor LprI family protein n=1 Tax=Clostridium celatum TaxID=36834 RepID=UPI00319E9684
MKKTIIFIMLVAMNFFISCGNSTNSEITTQKENEIVSNNEENSDKENDEGKEEQIIKIEDNEEDEVVISKSQAYLDRYFQLEKELEDSLAGKYSGTTIDMKEAVSIEYDSWDELLNEIYGVLQEQLSEEEMKAVREEQIQWLTIRDSKAGESANEVEGGTMEPLVYESSLTQSTKERCYELINNYMK